MRKSLTHSIALGGALLALAISACSDAAAPPGPARQVRPHDGYLVVPGDRAPGFEALEICKFGSAAVIDVDQHQVAFGHSEGTFNLDNGDCFVVADFFTAEVTTLAAEETSAPAGFELDSIRVTDLGGNKTLITGSDFWSTTTDGDPATNDDEGWLAEFFNSEIGEGCTSTIGFWKNHSGFSNGGQADEITPLLTTFGPVLLGSSGGAKTVSVGTAALAFSILDMNYAGGHPSNGITKLYAQLLGAKLNIYAGASASSVASTIAAADAFLATHDQADWSGLTKTQQQQVLAWMTTLDDFNNGLIGPPHC
jgi:hypothetical protein